MNTHERRESQEWQIVNCQLPITNSDPTPMSRSDGYGRARSGTVAKIANFSGDLQRLEARAFGGVFDLPAFGFEFVADGVAAGEVLGFARGLAFFEQR